MANTVTIEAKKQYNIHMRVHSNDYIPIKYRLKINIHDKKLTPQNEHLSKQFITQTKIFKNRYK